MTPTFLALFEDDTDLYAYLDRLNQDGHPPELPAVDSNGSGFIATLTDPDADRVHHVVTDEGGRAHRCGGDCSEWDRCHWRPTYPVTALSAQDPDVVRSEIAKAEADS